ncbi:hypothetical protein [Saccharospirillum salsuginis]|uniref:Uncharacterized protein n=1 Tax=Saccharospirillum salsuginis TaxID=418750 RepID=A0A918KCK2_9GAMM|nr:hypothetical protein [Saccharospirillum salsuginis]GGX58662.1 hypothetical protein GCM10007392_28240 [Saccharospirillum salsuginis]
MSQQTPAGLSESDRRHYLSAMGIQSWYPRVRLPCAPEPILFDLDDTEARVGPATETLSPAPEPEARERPGAPTPEPTPPTGTPVEATRSAATAPRGQGAPVPRFVLSLSVVGDFLITDSLAKGMEQPSQSGQQLLVNIVSALGVSASDVRTHHVIHWPLFTNPRVDQGIEQARIYVDEKLDQFIRQFEPKTLLSFGAVMPRLQNWEQPQGEYNGLPWVGLPSIYRMLSDPKQKAVAWNRLRPLAQPR